MILTSCLFLVVALTPAVGSQGEQAVDADAVEAYRAGEHAVARARWDELLRTTTSGARERGRILYNSGNAAARGGDWFDAGGYYTAALQETPRDIDLWANLEFARREAGLEPADRGDLAATLGRLLSAWTVEEARWISLGGVLLLAAALAFEAVRGGRGGRVSAWGGVAIALLASAPLARHELSDDAPKVFVVAEKGLALRSEPRSDAQVLERAEPGTSRREMYRFTVWFGVETTTGTKGWVPEGGVLVLPDLAP